jgi:ATP-dependent Clp protease ATP-binding subunit ClpC
MTSTLPCTVCGARGYLGERQCPNCRGFSFAVLFGDKVLGWRRSVDRFSIATRRAAKVANRVIDYALLSVACLALAELVFEVLVGVPFSSSYWMSVSNPSLAFFWFGAFCVFLYVSRRRSAKYSSAPVLRRAYGADALSLASPTGWENVRQLRSVSFIDVSRSYAPATLVAVERAALIAGEAGHQTVDLIHLFAALLEQKETAVLFARAGTPIAGLEERAGRAIAALPAASEAGTIPSFSLGSQAALLGAYAEAYVGREERVSPAALMLGVAEDPTVAEILNDLSITPEILKNVAAWSRINAAMTERFRRYRRLAALKPAGSMDRAMTAIATPILDRFSRDLTRAARFGRLPFLVDREAELNAVFRAIEGGRASAALVGEPGVGKDAIVYGIAERMVEEDVPEALRDKRLVSISISDLVAGAADDAGGRLLSCLDEVARSRNIVLVVENIDALAGVSSGGVDLSDMFATELSRGYFFCIATAYPNRFKRLEGRPLGNALERVDVIEPEGDAAIRILMSVVGGIEAEQRVFFTYQAIERAVTLSSRYLHDRYLPEKAIEILREAAQLTRKLKGEKSLVGAEEVAQVVSEKSHVPVAAVTEEERDKLLNLEAELHKRVIGQDEAVKAVAAALRRARAELRSKKRPIAAFMFLGPTGVGKTELAKTIAEVYFGAEKNMVRLDMSEYQEASSIHRLIGIPGESGGGLLTEAIRQQPFTLLLLDEFEKAHPDILNIFLQVMDDGRLTDNGGRTVDFTNCIIVSTSNAGSQFIQDSIRAGAAVDDIKKGLLNEQLKGIFRPELLNRFDGVIVFKPLTKDEIEQVAWLMIGGITDELEGKGITFRATDEAVAELAAVGFDPVFGARPMRRAIQEKVENALADYLLKEKIERRDTVVLEPAGIIKIEKGKKL